jgi:hypothetical protein
MSGGQQEAARVEKELRNVARAADVLAAALSDAKDAVFPIDEAFIEEVNEALAAQGLDLKLVRDGKGSR